MLRNLKSGTLHLRRPFGGTLALALILLVLIATGAEITARAAAAAFPGWVPSIGSPHRQLEISLARLATMAERKGRIDCIFIGSSVVYRGIDPVALKNGFEEQTRHKLDCFNLGVSGMTASTTAKLAEIIVAQYHPALLVFGTTARDYTNGVDEENLTGLEDIPWMRYRLGQPDPEGWLVDHSFALRYLLVHRNWMQTYYADSLVKGAQDQATIRADGFNPFQGTVKGTKLWPFLSNRNQVERNYGAYAMTARQLAGLDRILSLDRDNMRVVVVTMPLNPIFYSSFGNGKDDYDHYAATVAERSRNAGVLWVPEIPASLVPDPVWYNAGHLNAEGAAVLSKWLGSELGKQLLHEPIVAGLEIEPAPR